MNKTGNPVPSGAPDDFEDNCKTIDIVVNGQVECTENRIGKFIRTLFGFNKEADAALKDVRERADGIIAQAGGVKVVGEFGDSQYDVLNQEFVSRNILYSTKQAKLFGKFLNKLKIDGGAIINCIGTSNTSNNWGQKGYPFFLGEVLSDVYQKEVVVNNLGVSGGTVKTVFNKWKDSTPTADLAIMEWVGNDQRLTKIDDFIQNLEDYVRFEIDNDRAVLLITSPKTTHSDNYNRDIYVDAIFMVAKKYGIYYMDNEVNLKNCENQFYHDSVHLNEKGNCYMANRIAASLFGETLANPKVVGSGSTLLTRPSIDSVVYGENSVISESSSKFTPSELWNNNNYGIIASLRGSLGKSVIYYSFYASADNLFIVPCFTISSGSKIKISIDGGQGAPTYNIYRSLNILSIGGSQVNKSLYNEDGVYEYENTSSVSITNLSNDLYMQPIPLIVEGWHTIKIEVDNANVLFFGLEFHDASNFYRSSLVKHMGRPSGNRPVISETVIPIYRFSLLNEGMLDTYETFKNPIYRFTWVSASVIYTFLVKTRRQDLGGWYLVGDIEHINGALSSSNRNLESISTDSDNLIIKWKDKLKEHGSLSITVL